MFRPTDPAQRVLAIRKSLAPFVLPRPEALGEALGSALPDAAALALWGRETAGLPLVWDVWRRRTGTLSANWARLGASPQHGGLPDDMHDRFFGIERGAGRAKRGLLQGLLLALESFCLECTGAREFKEHADIPAALIEVWQLVLDVEAPVLPAAPVALAPIYGRAPDPARRWLIGHHVFATLTQSLIWALLRHEREQAGAPAADAVASTEAFLQRMARLYRASASAFRFTADFAPAAYENLIRPSMSEPHVPPGFSGSMSLDHGHLVATMTRLRPLLAEARDRCPEAHADMAQALAQVYDDHRHVCQRFAGVSGTSLRSERLAEGLAAVELLERFKTRRLQVLTCPADPVAPAGS